MKPFPLALILCAVSLSSCSLSIGGNGLFPSSSDKSSESLPLSSADASSGPFIDVLGIYPNMHVSSLTEEGKNLIEGLNGISPDEYGFYYYGSNYYMKAKAAASPMGLALKFSDGEEVREGEEYYFLCEPIEWKILSSENGLIHLISSFIIDTEIFDEDSNNYASSHIREWLNGSFFKTAFAHARSSNIERVDVDNSAETTAFYPNDNACKDTIDFVYLPSFKEIFNSDAAIEEADSWIYATDYALARGLFLDQANSLGYKENLEFYWTRSPFNTNAQQSSCVMTGGDHAVNEVNLAGVGVRPCITVNSY